MLPNGDYAWLRPLYYPRRKVERAREHIEELKRELISIVAGNPFINGTSRAFTPMMDFGSGFPDEGPPQHFIQDYMAPPSRAAMLIGDILHNLRSALDILACELVQKYGNQTEPPDPADLSKIGFPFPKAPENEEAEIASKRFNRAGPDAVAIYRTLKPWELGNRDLWALNQLNIIDKHRMAIPSTGEVVVNGEIRVRPDGKQVHVPTSHEITFTLPKSAPLGGEPLPSTLVRLADLCDEVISKFANLPSLQSGLHAARPFG